MVNVSNSREILLDLIEKTIYSVLPWVIRSVELIIWSLLSDSLRFLLVLEFVSLTPGCNGLMDVALLVLTLPATMSQEVMTMLRLYFESCQVIT